MPCTTYKGDFYLSGTHLRSKGLNRIGNLLVPNDNYCKFEDWIIPIFDQMLKEQTSECSRKHCPVFHLTFFLFVLQNVLWTPSKVIARLGKEINNESFIPLLGIQGKCLPD
ncbi:Deoxyhypusine synthase [Vitis vinifera]|uniref:Deoxyhypusine synthase n=1 Tax=Vitis vinifera TaxID=29760 RepID=A0A438EXR9_VITVI|nr:Deoxyhypusine synthase [Vitis vinifera]